VDTLLFGRMGNKLIARKYLLILARILDSSSDVNKLEDK
jgi:hypothetical protein